MTVIGILVGLGLTVCGIALVCAVRRGGGKRKNPPPLPPRVRVNPPQPVRRIQPRPVRTASAVSSLPPRRVPDSALGRGEGIPASALGPRGLRPAQFPCCPYDKQRNVPGKRQLIFWDGSAGCYRCARGHRFKSNGRII